MRPAALPALVVVALTSCGGADVGPPRRRAGPCTELHVHPGATDRRRIDHAYDRAGRLIATAIDQGADGDWDTIDLYPRDTSGHAVARLRFGPGTSELLDRDGDGHLLQRAVHEAGRLVEVVRFERDRAGRLVRAAGGLDVVTLGYDAEGRLRTVRQTSDDGRLREALDRTYDEAGALTDEWRHELAPGGAPEAPTRRTYVRNRDGRLVEERLDAGGGDLTRIVYDLDQAGLPRLTRTYDRAGVLRGVTWTVRDDAGNPLATIVGDRAGAVALTLGGYGCWDSSAAPPAVEPDAGELP